MIAVPPGASQSGIASCPAGTARRRRRSHHEQLDAGRRRFPTGSSSAAPSTRPGSPPRPRTATWPAAGSPTSATRTPGAGHLFKVSALCSRTSDAFVDTNDFFVDHNGGPVVRQRRCRPTRAALPDPGSWEAGSTRPARRRPGTPSSSTGSCSAAPLTRPGSRPTPMTTTLPAAGPASSGNYSGARTAVQGHRSLLSGCRCHRRGLRPDARGGRGAGRWRRSAQRARGFLAAESEPQTDPAARAGATTSMLSGPHGRDRNQRGDAATATSAAQLVRPRPTTT